MHVPRVPTCGGGGSGIVCIKKKRRAPMHTNDPTTYPLSLLVLVLFRAIHLPISPEQRPLLLRIHLQRADDIPQQHVRPAHGIFPKIAEPSRGFG